MVHTDGIPSEFRNIIIAETDCNKKGDLFNQLVYDAFCTLGFSIIRSSNIQRVGREIDMILQHRTEKRIAIVESKATKKPIGGTDINKFVGVLDVERNKYEQDGLDVVGYFVSMSGFTASALEQEKERLNAHCYSNSNGELVLMGPHEIVRELLQGNIICSLMQAVSAVRKSEKMNLLLCKYVDLLASEYGWIWVLYYSQYPCQVPTYFALIHADGNHLNDDIVKPFLSILKSQSTAYSNLIYLKPNSCSILEQSLAKEAYFQYLSSELGEIKFEGMPADKRVSAIKVNLEHIFIPLSFRHTDEDIQKYGNPDFGIDEILTQAKRVAILAKPGGGKSTLICRIALAYAYPERRNLVNDKIPDYNLFPIYIRCRDLDSYLSKSIFEIIVSRVDHAEISQYKDSFKVLVENELQTGQLLLLVDGLDEISKEQQRIAFVNQLKTFIATYPSTHLIITSRETGFRAIAENIASYCEQYSIVDLSQEQIRNFCLKWHQAIQGDSVQTRTHSDNISRIILSEPRFMALAKTPLLLTTVLCVNRWIGYLPTKKCQLYEEMIRLLLITWNAVAHAKLDLDEVEPQLAYVAHYMTLCNQKKISKECLNKCIIEARKALPDLLGYTNISPPQFINLVEERSNLLVYRGMEKDENGQLVPFYEFSHLSFQEYLTAKAIFKRWIPNISDRDSDIFSVLENHIDEQQWIEVIPLIAVLLGRDAEKVIDYLLKKGVENTFNSEGIISQNNIAAHCLANCIANEVPMSPEILKQAIEIVVKNERSIGLKNHVGSATSINMHKTIHNGKYGVKYREIVKQILFYDLDINFLYEFSDAWLKIHIEDNGFSSLKNIMKLLNSNQRQEYITGTLLMIQFAVAFGKSNFWNLENKQLLLNIYSAILNLLEVNDILSNYVATWCVAWSGYNERDIIPHELVPKITEKLLVLWSQRNLPHNLRRIFSWGIASVCMPELKINNCFISNDAIELHLKNQENEYDLYAALYLGILTHLWSREDVQIRLRLVKERLLCPRFLVELGYVENRKEIVSSELDEYSQLERKNNSY